jgi:transcriptional regulator of heat shock response
MGITERQNKILDAVIGEYIESAHPVSSQQLKKKYDFEIRPAMLRIEMQKLTDEGYLRQPHTSAGRVPTDKGYRFFVDELLARQSFAAQNLGGLKKEFEDFEAEIDEGIKFLQSLTKKMAEAADALVLSYLESEKIFWKEGWEEVLREPEFEAKEFRVNFTKFLENFEENIGDLKINSEIKIYIGRENPYKKAEDFSIIISKCHLGEEEGIVSLLGPKRMDYDKNIGLMSSLWKKKKNQTLKT